MASLSKWTAWFDGATAGSNPGVRGIGGLLCGPKGERIEISHEIGPGTNNSAEYAALIAVLDAAVEAQVQEIDVFGDSLLVVNQVNGAWSIANKDLIPLCRTAIALRQAIPVVRIQWIPREVNKEADRLSKAALAPAKPSVPDPLVWMTISRIAEPFCLSAVALGKRMRLAGLRDENGKPTQRALDEGVALRVENGFGHTTYWHRQRVPAFLRAALLLD